MKKTIVISMLTLLTLVTVFVGCNTRGNDTATTPAATEAQVTTQAETAAQATTAPATTAATEKATKAVKTSAEKEKSVKKSSVASFRAFFCVRILLLQEHQDHMSFRGFEEPGFPGAFIGKLTDG